MTNALPFFLCSCRQLGGSFVYSLRPFHLFTLTEVFNNWELTALLLSLQTVLLSIFSVSCLPLHLLFLVLRVLYDKGLSPCFAPPLSGCLFLPSLCVSPSVLLPC